METKGEATVLTEKLEAIEQLVIAVVLAQISLLFSLGAEAADDGLEVFL